MEATSVSNRWTDDDVVYIHNGILLGHEKEQDWVICRDMDGPRDSIHTYFLTEVSQEEENKYCILMHICGI